MEREAENTAGNNGHTPGSVVTGSKLYRSELLRAAAAMRKLSDDAIAVRTAVYTEDRKPLSRQTVAKVCNGSDGIYLATLAAVAAVVKVPMADLFAPRGPIELEFNQQPLVA